VHGVIELGRLVRVTGLEIPGRVARRPEGGQTGVVDPQVVGVGVAGLVITVDNNDLGPGPPDDGD
jgi:hypothetical protein